MSADQASSDAGHVNQSTADCCLLPVSSPKNAQVTYRVRGIPLEYSLKRVRELLRSILDLDTPQQNIEVRSMAMSLDQRTKTATVNFKVPPTCLSPNKVEWTFEVPDTKGTDTDDNTISDNDIIPETPRITIDTHFKGLTVLRSFRNVSEHYVDCIAISGLGGHAFGSFKERGGSYMWLRDSLPFDLPNARIMTYGYETQLHGSNSFQDLEAIASTFRLDLQALTIRDSNYNRLETKPIIFIAHSLGGLVVKEAIIQMKRDRARSQLDYIYGALFFGVPNQGMEIASLVPMVKNQQNKAFLHSLGKESQILRNQCREFPKAFEFRDSEIVCFYETEMSPTAAYNGTRWTMTGPLRILVDSSSARHGRPWENESHHCSAINRNHSELVKFSRNDQNYERVLAILKQMVSTAVSIIPRGMSSTDAEFLRDILRRLSPPDPSANHERARAQCQPNTGLWFTDSESFSKWKSSPSSFVWLHGIPGCGKTVLSSTIIQHTTDQFEDDAKVGIAYFYFDFNEVDKQKPENLLLSLLAQLASQSRNLPKSLKNLYASSERSTDDKRSAMLFEGKIGALISLISEYDQVYICLDALDECNDRKQALELLDRILGKRFIHLHILVTSRREWDLEPLAEMSTECVDIQSAVVDADIRLYIANQLDTDKILKKRPAHVKDTIMEALMKDAKGMFRWVTCQMDVLRACITPAAIEKALNSLPKTLDETYNRVLRGIPLDRRKDALRILQWLVFSREPMRIDELAELLVADPDLCPEFDLKRRPFDPQDITCYCGSLVSTQSSTKVIRLAHYSVQEFLLSDRLTGECQFFQITKQTASISIAKTCLSYLTEAPYPSSCVTRSPEPSSSDIESVLPLAKYAALCWMTHAKGVVDSYTDNLDFFIVRFLRNDVAQSAWINLCDPDYAPSRLCAGHRKVQSPLYYAALFGLHSPVKMLLDYGVDINTQGGLHGNALQAASIRGHDAVVRLLLEFGVDVNATGGFYRNALCGACSIGNKVIMQLLLDNKADVNAGGGVGLSLASFIGDEALVQLLFDIGADVNVEGSDALAAASEGGHEAIVRMLLDHGAAINAQGKDNNFALQEAASNGHETIVRILLDHGAAVSAQGKDNNFALQEAASNGHETIVRILLDHGASVNMRGGAYNTAALHGAVDLVNKDVLSLLLEWGADANIRNGEGHTALQIASTYGRIDFVLLLLEKGANVNLQGGKYGSALYEASVKGDIALVQLLLEHGADVNTLSETHYTALQQAAEEGHEAVVSLLLEHGADVDARDENDCSVLEVVLEIRQRSREKYNAVIELLLQHGARPVEEFGMCGGDIERETLHSEVSRGDLKRKRVEEEEEEET